MSAKRTQTTFTFKSQNNASLFIYWLNHNTNDMDYGYPKFVDSRQVSEHGCEFCVEYIADGDAKFARGVATGIDLA